MRHNVGHTVFCRVFDRVWRDRQVVQVLRWGSAADVVQLDIASGFLHLRVGPVEILLRSGLVLNYLRASIVVFTK